MSNISNKTVGRGTPEPIRSGTSRKTSNGNDGRTENSLCFSGGECQGLRREICKNLLEQGIAPRMQILEKGLYGALACFEDDKTAAGILRFAKAIEAYEDLANFIKGVKLDG